MQKILHIRNLLREHLYMPFGLVAGISMFSCKFTHQKLAKRTLIYGSIHTTRQESAVFCLKIYEHKKCTLYNVMLTVIFFIMVKMISTLLENIKWPYLVRRDALIHFQKFMARWVWARTPYIVLSSNVTQGFKVLDVQKVIQALCFLLPMIGCFQLRKLII